MFQFNFGNRFGKNYREVPPEGGEEQPRQKKWGRGSGAKHVKKAAAGIVIALIAVFLASSCWYWRTRGSWVGAPEASAAGITGSKPSAHRSWSQTP